jgi:tetraacyldisaccharide 4'-kinase
MSTCTTWRRVVSGEAHGVGPALARGALSALAVPYRWGAALNDIVRSGSAESVGVPVISVGNLTAGGTGKTPFVALVTAELRKRGRRPVVLSRGYKAEAGQPSDEAKVLARRFPDVLHLHGCDRLELARRVEQAQLGDAIVLDDGFQARNLHRNLDICLIDATNPFGYGAVLPRGLLREPLSALYRARPVIITRSELAKPGEVEAIKATVLEHNPHARILVSEMRFSRTTDVSGGAAGSPSEVAGKRVCCASGIGNPDAFERGVRVLGGRVLAHVEMADHHAWTAADVKALAAKAREVGAEIVVTTAKDAVKLAEHAWPSDAPALRVLELDAAIVGADGAELFAKLLDEALA